MHKPLLVPGHSRAHTNVCIAEFFNLIRCSTTQRIKEACLTEQRENAEEKQECSVAEYPWVANLLVLDHKQAGHGEYDRDKEEVENTK